jgi:hypothetical protein
MRRVLAATICAAGVLAGPASVDADHGGNVPHDFAVGGGTNGFFQIGFSAQSAADGSDPTGFVSARSRPNGGWPVPFRFGGEVTCLDVEGNQASIKYRFDHADNPALVGGGIQIFVQDNGQPQDGDSSDLTGFLAPMNEAAFEASRPSYCVPPEAGNYTPSEEGDIVVHDAD